MSSGQRPFASSRLPRQRPGQSGSKRQKNRQEQTEKLCEAGLALFVKRGIEAVTIDEITKQAGVAKGTFYRYFDDKAELVFAVFAPLSTHLSQAFARASESVARAESRDDLRAAYEQLAVELAGVLLPASPVVRLYLQENRGPGGGAREPVRAVSRAVDAYALQLTERAHERGLLRALPPEITAFAVIGAVETLLFRHLEGTNFGDPAAAARSFVSMVLEGLARSGG